MGRNEITLKSVNYATVRVHPECGEASVYVELLNPSGNALIAATFDSIAEATPVITRWCLWKPEESREFLKENHNILMRQSAQPHQA
jgi:hypothetical protein